MLFAYLGPDTFLPLTSVIAAVVGGLLMFGKAIVAMVKGTLAGFFGGRKAEGPAVPGRRSALLRGPHAGTEAQPKEAQPSSE